MPLSQNSLFLPFSFWEQALSGSFINRASILPEVSTDPHLRILASLHKVDDYAYNTKLCSWVEFSPLSFVTRTSGWALIRQLAPTYHSGPALNQAQVFSSFISWP